MGPGMGAGMGAAGHDEGPADAGGAFEKRWGPTQTGRTFSACGPFGPWVISNSTFWFSSSVR